MLKMIKKSTGKFYTLTYREGLLNNHNGKFPKENWLLQWEKEAIVKYAEIAD